MDNNWTLFGGSFLGVAFFLFLLVLSICWLIFPFLVMSGIGRLEKLFQKSINIQDKRLAQLDILLQKTQQMHETTNKYLELISTELESLQIISEKLGATPENRES